MTAIDARSVLGSEDDMGVLVLRDKGSDRVRLTAVGAQRYKLALRELGWRASDVRTEEDLTLLRETGAQQLLGRMFSDTPEGTRSE